MNINIFDGMESLIRYDSKFVQIRSYIFIAESITFTARDFDSNVHNLDIDTISDEMTYEMGKLANYDDEEFHAAIEDFKSLMPLVKKTKNQKHKDKKMLWVLGTYREHLFDIKRNIKEVFRDGMEHYSVTNLLPFVKDKIWNIPLLSLFPDPKKEDDYIQPICETILHRKQIMGFDEILMKEYVATTLNYEDDDEGDFIKIPLWDVPVAEELTYDKIRYTRNDLQTTLKPFKAHLSELSDELAKIPFVLEHIPKIKNLCREKILDHIVPVQQAIDNSIYLSHQRNQSQEDTRSKLFLGVASNAMLVDYLEIFKIIAPYVATEVRERLYKQIDLMATRMFFFQDVHPEHRVGRY